MIDAVLPKTHGQDDVIAAIVLLTGKGKRTMVIWLDLRRHEEIGGLTTYREAKRQNRVFLDDAAVNIGIYESLQAFCAEVEQLLSVFLFLFLREAILRLSDLKLSITLKGDEADTEVRTTYKDSFKRCKTLVCSGLTKI